MSNPYVVAANQAASGSTTLVLTVGQINGSTGGNGTSANDVIHVSIQTSAVGQTITSVTDSQGNKYAQVGTPDSSQVYTTQWVSQGNTTALVSGTDTITITYSGTGGTKLAIAIGMTGVMPVPDKVPTTVNGASGTTTSISSGALTEPTEIVVAVLSTGSIATAPAWTAPFTQLANERVASNPWLTVAYQQVSSSSSVTATATFSSTKFCILMATFIIPSPSFPYLVGEASAPSGGSTTLQVPIRSNISSGDTLVVGALCTSGSVTGVTDTNNNVYVPVPAATETTNTGCQLYTFAAYNAQSGTAKTQPLAGLVGNTCDYRNYTFNYTATNASPCVFTNTSAGQTIAIPNGTQVQLNGGTPPGGFSNGTTYYVVATSGVNFSLAASLGGTPINSSSTGSGSQTGFIVGTNTELGSSQAADTYSGLPWAYGPTGSQKLYYNAGNFPQSFTLQNGQDASAIAAAGTRFWLCYKPAIDGSDLTAMHDAIQWWINHTSLSQLKVVIYQEPQGQSELTSQTDPAKAYINCVKAYAPMVHSLGLKVVYDAAGSHSSEWVSWYAGNSYVDELAIDFYGSTWSQQTKKGTTNLDPTLPMRQLADNNGKPFGFGEIGQAVYGTGATLSNSLFIQYITYLTDIMSNRLAAGLPNSDVMWYNGLQGMNGNTILAGDWRIPYLTALYNALTTQAATVNVAYSTNASVQAAIVVGDNNVANNSDKTVGSTATSGTTASTGPTGLLSQAEEHIIAFVTDLTAGGQPTLGDSLTNLGTVQGGTTAYLTAGFKSVATTSSDTPSATIVSTTWSMGAVTNPVLLPVIVTVPNEGFAGEAYSQTLQAQGGVGTLTWGFTGGSLPPGLTLSTGGVLSGTPTLAGSYIVTLTATDSLGLQGTLQVTIIIVGLSGPGGAPAQFLPGNFLSPADCDMEGSIGYTWQSYSNAGTPSRTTNVSIAGNNSTMWSVPAAGTTLISTGFYPVVGGLTYITSGFILTGASRPCNIGFAWYDSTQALIGVVDEGVAVVSVPATWQPLSYASVAPGNAAYVKIIFQVQNASIGDTYNIDLAYYTQSIAQVLVDWNNPTFAEGGSAGQMFMDVSPWVRLDQGITYTRGRQDAISEIQPGSATFDLQNDFAQFTRFNTESIPEVIGGSVNIQRRCQINATDETGQWWTRFDGPISEVDYSFDTLGNTSVAAITVTDVLAYLNRQDSLFCWSKEQALSNGPLYHWSLDDSGTVGGAGVAAETSGNNGPPMRLINSDSTGVAAIAWGDTSSGVETLADAVSATAPDGSAFWTPGQIQPSTALRGLVSGNVGPFTAPIGSVLFTPVQTAQSGQNTFIGNTGYMLEAELSTPIAPTAVGSDYSFECWFTMDPSIATNLGANYGPYVVMGLGSSRTYTNLLAGLYLNSGTLKFKCATYNQPPAFKGLNWSGVPAPTATASTAETITADHVKVPHHLVVTIQGDPSAATVTLWLDGSSVGTFTLPTGQTYDTVTIGGAYGGCGAFFGNISLLSVYNYVMPQQQIIQDCQLGQYGMWECPTDDCVAQLADYANVPTFWSQLVGQHVGLSLAEYVDISGSNALAAMQQFEKAEMGLLFVDANGTLNYHTRDWRMGYPGPDLMLPPDSFSADMQYELIDQFMCNEMGVTGPNTLGATATTIVQSQNTGATSTETTTQTLVQASYVNTASQQQYGVYAQSPVSSPTAVPLITWSRAYAALGIPSFSYWPDPNLADVAAWNANSRSDPWLLPAHLQVDLLTLDTTTGLGISDFYGLEIDNMLKPNGTLPTSLPNDLQSLQWFIEGISETISLSARTITFYTSPGEAQRAWIPGDSTYGVLGQTARVGVSGPDVSTPQADGKSVSHDAGPPYWPPAFSDSMNNPSGNGHNFIGANDLRGIAQNLSLLLKPPLCIVSASSETQNVPNGSLSSPQLFWDVVHVDTAGGMGLIAGWPNWYVVTVPGWYEIDANVTWSVTGTGLSGYAGQAWIVVAQQGAQAIVSGAGNPTTVNQYVCPVGECVRFNGAGMTPVVAATTRMYLGLGDMVGVAAEQNYTSARGTSTAAAGSSMSIRWTGLGQVDDRTEINSSIANGGTVSLNSHGSLQQVSFSNTHTYSYQGAKGFNPLARRNTDRNCFQGLNGKGNSEGSQASQIVFNASSISSTLTGHTILSATLTATNLSSWYSTGAKMMLGTTTVTPGGSTFNAAGHNSNDDIMHQTFQQSQTLTFAIPISIVKSFLTGGSTALILGDSNTTDLNYYGSWQGGPGAWSLVVNYV